MTTIKWLNKHQSTLVYMHQNRLLPSGLCLDPGQSAQSISNLNGT